MRTAIMLLLLLAGASVLGTLIKQNASPGEYIESYGRVGYHIINTLGLDDVYHSRWYLLLLLLLVINLVVCSARRFASAWRRTFCPQVVVEHREISGGREFVQILVHASVGDVVLGATRVLRGRGYCVKSEDSSDSSFLYAAKGRLGIWGPYLVHFSVLVIFIGAVIGGFAGSRGFLRIAEGESADHYHSEAGPVKLGFSVLLRDFVIQTDERHRPTAYRSYLEVYEDDMLTRKKVVDVNYPLSYKGISFYQSDCGLAMLVLRVTFPHAECVDVKFDLTRLSEVGERLKLVESGGKKLAIYLHNLAPDYTGDNGSNTTNMPLHPACELLVSDTFPEQKGLDAWSRLGWLEVGQSADYKKYRIKFVKAVDYTVLDVSRNPGLPVVYFGFALMVMGVFLSFYVPWRVIRLCTIRDETGSRVLLGCAGRALDDRLAEDFEAVRSSITLEAESR
ncbi:MAG: cytochrome c biogenesis protein ResB [Armatimonadota bacterium]